MLLLTASVCLCVTILLKFHIWESLGKVTHKIYIYIYIYIYILFYTFFSYRTTKILFSSNITL